MKFKFIYLISTCVAATMLLASCGKDKPANDSESESVSPILFSPIIEGDFQSTKGTMLTGTVYGTDPFMAAAWTGTDNQFEYTKVKQFTHAQGSMHTYWSTTDATGNIMKEYIWKSGETKTFYAYANLPENEDAVTVVNSSSASQTMTYDVTEIPSASDQTDILLGYYNGEGQTPAEAGKAGTGWVGHFAPINFRHPLSAIIFKKGEIPDWAEGDKITEIQLDGVYATCTCTDNGSITWGTPSGSTAVSMSDASGLSIVSDVIGESFFLIPQNNASQNIQLNVTITLGGTEYDASATMSSDDWQAGYYYTYTLNYSTGHEIELDAVLEDWGKINEDVDMDAGSVQTYDDPSVDTWTDENNGNISYYD